MKKFYIHTFGCQMNKYDSEVISGILTNASFSNTPCFTEADVILVNTCSVREHAEQRAYSKLIEFLALKKNKKDLIVGVVGCLADAYAEGILWLDHKRKLPTVDLIIGPNHIRNIDLYVKRALNGEKPVIVVGDYKQDWEKDFTIDRVSSKKAWIAISKGCNSFCSYCIVPYVRGREESKPVSEILKEVRKLVQSGYREINLLGQNVNSYGKDLNEGIDFADLLRSIDELEGDFWIRFFTSHPKDIPAKLVETISKSKRICNHFHLPIQSGSDKILKLMNRGYTASYYKNKVKEIRDKIKEISITSDIIVGFPGESEEDFNETIKLVKEVRFDFAFTFKYSPRTKTKAYELKDDVKKEDKQQRLSILMGVQNQIALENNKELIGRILKVLVERDTSQKNEVCRTETNKIVEITNKDKIKQDFISVKIIKASPYGLKGEEVCQGQGRLTP
ncbi:MAG: tRNA (N6-isopentenyl adenosine(37)-C2)-methylthiotransferase MiaB [Candidatus Firestonebacteria bacterium]